MKKTTLSDKLKIGAAILALSASGLVIPENDFYKGKSYNDTSFIEEIHKSYGIGESAYNRFKMKKENLTQSSYYPRK